MFVLEGYGTATGYFELDVRCEYAFNQLPTSSPANMREFVKKTKVDITSFFKNE